MQPVETLQQAQSTTALETKKREYEMRLRNLRAYQQMNPTQKNTQAIRDCQRTLADIETLINQARRRA